jgi:hypothetical protein
MLTTSQNEKDLKRVETFSEVAQTLSKPLTEQNLTMILKKYF